MTIALAIVGAYAATATILALMASSTARRRLRTITALVAEVHELRGGAPIGAPVGKQRPRLQASDSCRLPMGGGR